MISFSLTRSRRLEDFCFETGTKRFAICFVERSIPRSRVKYVLLCNMLPNFGVPNEETSRRYRMELFHTTLGFRENRVGKYAKYTELGLRRTERKSLRLDKR